MFMPIGGAAIETFSTPPPHNSCHCHILFDTNILEMHASYTSRVMATFVFKFSKIHHYGNKSRLNGKNLNASIYMCDLVNVLFDAKILEISIIKAEL